jgi:hypothetical protein
VGVPPAKGDDKEYARLEASVDVVVTSAMALVLRGIK